MNQVPFYQPLLALEMFTRAIHGKDIASGELSCLQGAEGYKTVGPAESTYREGNATVQFNVVPTNATYNTTTNAPNPVMNGTAAPVGRKMGRKAKRAFKPMFKSRNYLR